MKNEKPPNAEPIQVKIPSAKRKTPGGADHADWNNRTTNLMVTALPINLEDSGEVSDAATAVISGIMEIDPADPIEGVLASQLVVAHEAAMRMYQQAWAQPPEFFDARMKYLAQADRATRTAAMLTERLDQHRSRGQQQIVVKHVTVNADQAMVADSIVAGSAPGKEAMQLMPASAAKPMESIKPIQKLSVPAGGGAKAR